MTPLALYCKSYRTDLRRLLRLAHTVAAYNADRLPFYVSVPNHDFELFDAHLKQIQSSVELLRDEDILRVSPGVDVTRVQQLPGHISQQIVKSEFWRLGLCDMYVCLDSDAQFIRPFHASDFMAPDGTPYTMMDEAHDLLEGALSMKRQRIADDFTREADLMQAIMGRVGRRYSFGPFPLVWHRAVWKSLSEHYLQPHHMTLVDAIGKAPIESRWYGEALLAYKAVPLLPCQALFKVYHYAWQYDQDQRRGITSDQLASIYCGVITQSAWERELDWPVEGGSWTSKLARRVRRLARRS